MQIDFPPEEIRSGRAVRQGRRRRHTLTIPVYPLERLFVEESCAGVLRALATRRRRRRRRWGGRKGRPRQRQVIVTPPREPVSGGHVGA